MKYRNIMHIKNMNNNEVKNNISEMIYKGYDVSFEREKLIFEKEVVL